MVTYKTDRSMLSSKCWSIERKREVLMYGSRHLPKICPLFLVAVMRSLVLLLSQKSQFAWQQPKIHMCSHDASYVSLGKAFSSASWCNVVFNTSPTHTNERSVVSIEQVHSWKKYARDNTGSGRRKKQHTHKQIKNIRSKYNNNNNNK